MPIATTTALALGAGALFGGKAIAGKLRGKKQTEENPLAPPDAVDQGSQVAAAQQAAMKTRRKASRSMFRNVNTLLSGGNAGVQSTYGGGKTMLGS